MTGMRPCSVYMLLHLCEHKLKPKGTCYAKEKQKTVIMTCGHPLNLHNRSHCTDFSEEKHWNSAVPTVADLHGSNVGQPSLEPIYMSLHSIDGQEQSCFAPIHDQYTGEINPSNSTPIRPGMGLGLHSFQWRYLV